KDSEGRWLHFLARCWEAQAQYEKARELFTQAVAVREAAGDIAGAAQSNGSLADVAMLEGRLAEAEDRYQRVFALVRRAGSPPLHLVAHLGSLADLAFLKGELDRADRLACECLTQAGEVGDAWHVGLMHNAQARIARERGDPGRARQL